MKFLSRRFVVAYQARLIDLFGGLHGIRDEDLLDSALAQPEATFEGEYLHGDVWEMAAAYGFHLCSNHPFLDGNKRIAAVAMGTFLGDRRRNAVWPPLKLRDPGRRGPATSLPRSIPRMARPKRAPPLGAPPARPHRLGPSGPSLA